MGIECNQTRSSARKAPNMAKPRTREASMEDKAQKQASVDMQNKDDPNPFDMGRGTWMMTKTIGFRSGPNQQAKT